MKVWIRTGLVALGLVTVACSADVAGPGDDLEPSLGIIAWTDAPADFLHFAGAEPGDWDEGNWGDRPPLVAPTTVAAGTPFTVTATTTRPNGCWFPGDHSMVQGGNVAEITVRDYRTDSEVCALIFGWTSRDIELQFDEPGEAVVRLVGQRIAGDDFGGGEQVVFEHVVVVQ